MIIKKTKSVVTIGPATFNEKIIDKMLNNGMDVARLNFSHGNHAEQLEKIAFIKAAAIKKKAAITLLADTKGPEIRTHDFRANTIINKGSEVRIFWNKEILGNNNEFSVNYNKLYKSVKINDPIMIDDGKLILICKKITNNYIVAEAKNSHEVASKRGVNLPGAKLLLDFLSKKDKDDLIFACKQKFDCVALSFVSNKEDVILARKFLSDNGGANIKLISKIESVDAIKNIDEIIEESNAIMIARGDLSVEIGFHKVPRWQIEIIKKCAKKKKQVIVATQMLESMTGEIKPTRAEVNDVYLSSYFGADSTMLSAESAKGKFPVQAISTMSNILKYENLINRKKVFYNYQEKSVFNDDSDIYVMWGENDKIATEFSSQKLYDKFLFIIIKWNNKFININYGYYYGIKYLFLENINNLSIEDIKKEIINQYKINVKKIKIIK